jgi:hypothetical protein
VALAAVVIAAGAAYAATPEESYLAARDKAIATMKKLEAADASDAKMQAADKAALADLTRRLVALVGPVAVKGFPHPPTVNLETLGDGQGNAMLDGLSFLADPEKPDTSKLVVTTRPLFAAWIKASGEGADAADRLPEAAEEAMRADTFYTAALESDAAFSRALEIELEKPAGVDFAFAALGRWSQDIGPTPLDRIVAGVVKGGRILVADVEAAAKAPELPACKGVWDAANARYDKLVAAYQKGGSKDEALVEESAKVQDQGGQDWLACEGKAVRAGASYPALKKEAQDLVARMAGG